MVLLKALKIIVPDSLGESLDLAGPGSLHTSPKPTTDQSSDWVEMISESGSRSLPAPLQMMGNFQRHPETDMESEESEGETGCGFEGRQSLQGE